MEDPIILMYRGKGYIKAKAGSCKCNLPCEDGVEVSHDPLRDLEDIKDAIIYLDINLNQDRLHGIDRLSDSLFEITYPDGEIQIPRRSGETQLAFTNRALSARDQILADYALYKVSAETAAVDNRRETTLNNMTNIRFMLNHGKVSLMTMFNGGRQIICGNLSATNVVDQVIIAMKKKRLSELSTYGKTCMFPEIIADELAFVIEFLEFRSRKSPALKAILNVLLAKQSGMDHPEIWWCCGKEHPWDDKCDICSGATED